MLGSAVERIPPLWEAWLTHGREVAPTMQDLLADKDRMDQIKLRVAEAEQRWKQIPLTEPKKGLKARNKEEHMAQSAAPTSKRLPG
jgi:hypothetical protein